MTIAEFVNANSMRIPLADKSVHMAVTSPPYWALRDYGTAQWEGGSAECDHKVGNQVQDNKAPGAIVSGVRPGADTSRCKLCGAIRIDNQLGLEKLHDCLGWATGAPCGECFVCHVVAWAREVKRVLRDDGIFLLNIADSYAANRGYQVPDNKWGDVGNTHGASVPPGLKPKDMCLIPSRVALALQADGWWVRSDIIWAKPNPMPESCKDRPTKSHEYLWLLTKSARYYWDADAVREEAEYGRREITGGFHSGKENGDGHRSTIGTVKGADPSAGRNIRSVWQIATHPFPGSHFATYPPALVEPCIKAGTSERGCCPSCGKQWVRVVETNQLKLDNRETSGRVTGGTSMNSGAGNKLGGFHEYPRTRRVDTTLGWRPDCDCDAGDPVPCTVLDPFSGAATTGLVCQQLGRRYVGLDLSLDYIRMGRERCGIDALEAWKGNGKAHEEDLSDLPMFSPPPPPPYCETAPRTATHAARR